MWMSIGMNYSWGVMQAALVEEGLAKASTLSFVGSLQAGLMSALAIVNSRIMRFFGARATTMMAVGLMGVSQILAGFTTRNIGGLFVTSGLCMGVGVG